MDNTNAKQYLLGSQDKLLKHLQQVVKSHSFNYRTFGTEIEEFVTAKLIEIFTEGGFIKSKTDYKIAENKNVFPDFILESTTPPLAIEIKSGNHSKKDKGKWSLCTNSNNDMGTLNMWAEKLQKFGGENISYIFIEYNFNDREKKIIDVKIAPFYRFLGLGKEGTLKYREKDGNLRPKGFNEPSPITSLNEFKGLLSKTIIFRSKRIAKKHLLKIPQEERKKVLEEL